MLPVPITPARILDVADDSLTTDGTDKTDGEKAEDNFVCGISGRSEDTFPLQLRVFEVEE